MGPQVFLTLGGLEKIVWPIPLLYFWPRTALWALTHCKREVVLRPRRACFLLVRLIFALKLLKSKAVACCLQRRTFSLPLMKLWWWKQRLFNVRWTTSLLLRGGALVLLLLHLSFLWVRSMKSGENWGWSIGGKWRQWIEGWWLKKRKLVMSPLLWFRRMGRCWTLSQIVMSWN